jgi:hypothetical protein
MSRPTSQQIAGLNILDWLYFNQVLVYSVFSGEHLCCLYNIVEKVKAAVAAAGATGIEAEVMKHYILCYLEIFVSDENIPGHPDFEKVMRFNKDFFAAFIMAIGKKTRDYSSIDACSIAHGLIADVISAPVAVRFRLAERCLALEYPSAAHEALMWFAESEVIKCAKFRFSSRPNKNKRHEPLITIITRIGLLCEFELMRNASRRVRGVPTLAETLFTRIASELPSFSKVLVLQAGKLWIEKFHSIESVENSFAIFSTDHAFDKKYVSIFLSNLNLKWSRSRFCLGTSASWVGIIGAFYIVLLKSLGNSKAVYIENNSKKLDADTDTLANAAKDVMRRYGMEILGRTLYLRYREFNEKIRPRVVDYYIRVNVGDRVTAAEEEDINYFISGVIKKQST